MECYFIILGFFFCRFSPSPRVGGSSKKGRKKEKKPTWSENVGVPNVSHRCVLESAPDLIPSWPAWFLVVCLVAQETEGLFVTR